MDSQLGSTGYDSHKFPEKSLAEALAGHESNRPDLADTLRGYVGVFFVNGSPK